MLADRVKETSTTTGTGAFSLDGPASGFNSFSVFGTGGLCYYVATAGADWEVGIGTVTTGTPNSLARTTILGSSNAGAAVNWPAGTTTIFNATTALVAGGQQAKSHSGAVALHDVSHRGRGVLAYNNAADIFAVTHPDYTDRFGCHQYERVGLACRQTGATPVPMVVGDSGSTALNLVMPNNCAAWLRLEVLSYATGGSGFEKAWVVDAMYRRATSSPSLQGSVTKTVIAQGTSAAALDVALATSTGGQIIVNVTGDAGTSLVWTGFARLLTAGNAPS